MASVWFGAAPVRRGVWFVLPFLLILCLRAGDVRAQCAPATPCVTGPTILGTLGGTLSNSRGISDDGSAIAGVSFVPGNLRHAYRWEAGTMVDLGTLGGSESVTTALSGDGSVVVGWSYLSGNAALHAFRWKNGSMEDLGTLGGTNSDATAVSTDGSVVVGTSDVASGHYHAFRWEGGSMADLGTLGGNRSIATDVSGDGKVVVGSADTAASGSHAYRWEAGTMLDLGTLGGTDSDATAVSRDGSAVIGEAQTTGNAGYHAFLWKSGSLVDLGTLGGTQSYAIAVSNDGGVVVGRSLLGDNATLHAYRWEGGTMVDLGSLGGAPSEAHSLNHDGSVVGGSATDGAGLTQAFRWTADTGMQNLNTLLASAGVDMTGIRLIGVPYMTPDGTFMSGVATYSGQTRAYIVRYDDGIGGLTSAESVQQSVNALADDRAGLMAQQHGLANPLLGGDKPLTNDSEVGVFGMGGSAAGGGFARYATGGGLAVLAGVSYGEEAYQDAAIEDSLMGALAVRWLDPGKGTWSPFAEVGGWLAPEADLEFERSYMNGAGTATGIGSTHGDVSYYYARAGVVFDLGKREQVVVSGEIGRERLEVDGYSEALSAGNPFNAQVSAGTDEMDIVKARLAWSFGIAPRMDATLWGAGVYGFNRETDLVASVAGVGVLTAVTDDDTAWVEYGARVGYAVTEAVTFDVFVNGVSGDDDIGTRVHGGGGLRYRF